MYRSRLLQLQAHFAALVFKRNLQDVRTFAPLQTPKFSKNKGNLVVNILYTDRLLQDCWGQGQPSRSPQALPTDSSKRPAKGSGSSGRLKACLHLRSLIAMTTTTKTAVVKTTKTTITKAELKKTSFFLTPSQNGFCSNSNFFSNCF